MLFLHSNINTAASSLQTVWSCFTPRHAMLCGFTRDSEYAKSEFRRLKNMVWRLRTVNTTTVTEYHIHRHSTNLQEFSQINLCILVEVNFAQNLMKLIFTYDLTRLLLNFTQPPFKHTSANMHTSQRYFTRIMKKKQGKQRELGTRRYDWLLEVLKFNAESLKNDTRLPEHLLINTLEWWNIWRVNSAFQISSMSFMLDRPTTWQWSASSIDVW